MAQEAIDKGAFKSSRDGPRSVTNMVAVLRTATEIAGAMCYLHSLDILHSDLNGNNILLVSNTGIDDRPFSVKARLPMLSLCLAEVIEQCSLSSSGLSVGMYHSHSWTCWGPEIQDGRSRSRHLAAICRCRTLA